MQRAKPAKAIGVHAPVIRRYERNKVTPSIEVNI
ncbi:helix-turn-helix domain-containing protein [Niabella beijingensis]|nr:helix-turn-helix transcriptional regulator [Niabella beijingensis]MBZ4187806.1 helix-turn-helix transcriptional regulator [Niabella beijingensis]